MEKLVLSDRFAQILSEIGVKSVFTLTGGHIVPLLDSCRKEKIEIVDVRHEQNAVFAAEAYSRVSGKLGVALVTAGPGFMNSINSIATAHFSNVPLLVVSGRHYRRQEGRGGLQEFNHPPMVEKITKYASTILSPNEFEQKIYIFFKVSVLTLSEMVINKTFSAALCKTPFNILSLILSPTPLLYHAK